jgi:membrane protein YdbS with pleckstrin-like domain/predicted RNA-binding Zn-ribbon protein involved in translation (DUF1610 family)
MNQPPPAPFERLGPPGHRPDYVRSGENVVWIGKPVLRSIFGQVAAILPTFIFAFVFMGVGLFSPEARPFIPFIILGAIVLVFFIVIIPIIQLRRMEFVITDAGAYTRRGIISVNVNQTTFDKITDISYRQDVLGRILGYGTLNVNTAGSNTNALVMVGLARAMSVKRLLEETKERGRQQRRQTSGASSQMRASPAPAPFVPVFTPADQVATFRCTSCKASFRRPRSEAGSKRPCPECGKATIYKEAARRGRTRTN